MYVYVYLVFFSLSTYDFFLFFLGASKDTVLCSDASKNYIFCFSLRINTMTFVDFKWFVYINRTRPFVGLISWSDETACIYSLFLEIVIYGMSFSIPRLLFTVGYLYSTVLTFQKILMQLLCSLGK